LINYFTFGTRGFLTAGIFGVFTAAGALVARGFLTAGALASTTASGTTAFGTTITASTAGASTLYGTSATGAGVEAPKPNIALILFNIIMSPYEFIYIN
jgi:hypothetical protein